MKSPWQATAELAVKLGERTAKMTKAQLYQQLVNTHGSEYADAFLADKEKMQKRKEQRELSLEELGDLKSQLDADRAHSEAFYKETERQLNEQNKKFGL